MRHAIGSSNFSSIKTIKTKLKKTTYTFSNYGILVPSVLALLTVCSVKWSIRELTHIDIQLY